MEAKSLSDLRNDALDIIDYSIKAVLPDNAVKEAIKKREKRYKRRGELKIRNS